MQQNYQQQQHLMQMRPKTDSYYPNNITTDHIQQHLDENKSLILKIVESQNTGKLNECAENQARLQRNLMYLAAIADSQPQPPSVHSQCPSSGMMQAGSNYGQQAQQMTQQSLMAAGSSMLYSQQPYSGLQQQAAMHSHLGMSSGGGGSTRLHILQGEATSNAGGHATLGVGGFPGFGLATAREGLSGGSSKHDMGSGGGSIGGHGGENIYLKASDDRN